MGIPLIQQVRIGAYLVKQHLLRREKYPLVLMLEPLLQCNLACSGCGKIAHPPQVLKQRMTVADALRAVEDCGAPVVSIAGGEPLIHQEMPEMVRAIMARRRFVYLCTNAMLLHKKIDDYEPSPYFTFSVHLDGNRERHDASVRHVGAYDRTVANIRMAVERGFRVTINCTLFAGENPDEVAEFFDDVMSLGVEGITISPGFSYERAPGQDRFLSRQVSKELFRGIFRHWKARGRSWTFNQSSLFLDFLAGNRDYRCTAWSNPTYNIFGWQRPCYLLDDGGFVPTFQELMEATPWERFGTGRNPKCDNCMAHCGYEGTAVGDTFRRPLEALRVARRGPTTEGPMVPDPPVEYVERPPTRLPVRMAG